jgi:hypothetical protein
MAPSSGQLGLDVVRVLAAAQKSLELEGKTVAVEDARAQR